MSEAIAQGFFASGEPLFKANFQLKSRQLPCSGNGLRACGIGGRKTVSPPPSTVSGWETWEIPGH